MTIASAVRAILPRLVHLCACHRGLTLAVGVVLGVLSVGVAHERLGVTTDTSLLFSNSLKWKQSTDALAHAFPQNDGLLVAVVDGQIPEEAEATAAELAGRLRGQPALFRDVAQPDASAYLQANAFLLIGTKDLQDLLDRTVDAQPFLGQLVADPSLRGLFAALSLVAEGASRGVDAAGAGGGAGAVSHEFACGGGGACGAVVLGDFAGGAAGEAGGAVQVCDGAAGAGLWGAAAGGGGVRGDAGGGGELALCGGAPGAGKADGERGAG